MRALIQIIRDEFRGKMNLKNEKTAMNILYGEIKEHLETTNKLSSLISEHTQAGKGMEYHEEWRELCGLNEEFNAQTTILKQYESTQNMGSETYEEFKNNLLSIQIELVLIRGRLNAMLTA